jgi:hypothetical protein
MSALLLVTVAVAVAAEAPPTHQCGNSTSYCPAALPCCLQEYSPSKYGCEVPLGNNAIASAGCGDGLGPITAKTWCCKMGPGDPPSRTQGERDRGVQGAHLNPLGIFLRPPLKPSVPFIWRILSAFLVPA